MTHFLFTGKEICVAEQAGVSGRGLGRELCSAAPCGRFGSASTGLGSAALLCWLLVPVPVLRHDPTGQQTSSFSLVWFLWCFVVNEIWTPLIAWQNHLCHFISYIINVFKGEFEPTVA